MEKILVYLDTLEDVRQANKVKHKLSDIVLLVLLAMLANVEYWEEIEDFARFYEKPLKKYLDFPNGIPSHDTIQRVMATLNPKVTAELQIRWGELVSENKKDKLRKIFNIDGKTIKGNRSKYQNPLHIVSAYSKADGICYGQRPTDEKSNEITAIPKLIDRLSIEKCIITMDAMGTQKDIVSKIISKKADYCLAVKQNQQSLFEDIETFFNNHQKLDELKRNHHHYQTVEKARGQIERRDYYLSSDTDWLIERNPGWDHLHSIGMNVNTIERDGEIKVAKRFYVQSFYGGVEEFARIVRGHWAVESLHWLLDVVFREDANQTLNQTAAQNLNNLRKLSVAILKSLDLGKKNMSYKRKRFNLALQFENMIDKLFDL
jgi:predicted transposase YbfD/YdcC